MLLEIAQWLAKDVRVFNVFNYITLRAVLACLTALAVSLILGPYMIRKLSAYKIGQAVRDEGPRSHLTKAGTPTDRKSTRLNSSHVESSYAVFCLKKKK